MEELMRNKPILNESLLQQALLVAKTAALKAEEVIKSYYQDNELKTHIKNDQTPVTIADKESEQIIRAEIKAHFPEHDIFGEEFGLTDHADNHEKSDYLWLIDPIDGTKSFVRQYPFFSTQIALMYRGELVVGVSNAPIFEELAWAVVGNGAFLNDQAIHIATEFAAHSSCVSTGNIQSLVNKNWQKLGHLLTKFSKIRGYGDFYHYHLLASGKIDLIIESNVNVLDIAALSVIVKEAGGKITDLNGEPIGLDTVSILAGTEFTHALGLKTLNE